MELFNVQRYDGNAKIRDSKNEDEILGKLLKKVEKRKRKLVEVYQNDAKKANISLKESLTEDQSQENVEITAEKIVNSKNSTILNSAESKMNKVKNVELIEKNENDENVEIPDRESKLEDSQNKNLEGKNNQAEERQTDFQILGTSKMEKKKVVEMVLPAWLAYPTIISNKISQEADAEDGIDTIDYLSPRLVECLKFFKVQHLFPVQKEVIPWIIKAHSKPPPFRPRDVCISAPTGSGKTLAFALPIVQILSKRLECKIRALIVLPVNELAGQVYSVFKKLCAKTTLSVILLSKTQTLRSEQEQLLSFHDNKWYSKVDIVVTTPGRLVEHLHSTSGLCFKSLKFLVVDEADKIMDQVHHNWLYHLDMHINSDTTVQTYTGSSIPLCLNELENSALRQPHKMLFSATLSQDPEKLQNLRLFQPKLFTTLSERITPSEQTNNNEVQRGEFIGKYVIPAELTEKICKTEFRLKPLTLFSLIVQNNWRKFLCFTNSTQAAHRLAYVLDKLAKKSFVIKELSSNLQTQQRNIELKKFVQGKINGLVCSDAIARGIDIPNVNIVISYDSPNHIKTYIHRIGRTARAGQPGTAITLISENELKKFHTLISNVGKESIEEITVDHNIEEQYAKNYSTILSNLKAQILKEQQFKNIKEKLNKNRADNYLLKDETTAGKLQAQLSSISFNVGKLKT